MPAQIAPSLGVQGALHAGQPVGRGLDGHAVDVEQGTESGTRA